MPGYRNRIVHISQRPDEGGLNLDMEAAVIERLSERGRRAGIRLRDEFNWDNHAWVRYRSFLAALEVNLGQFGQAYEHPAPQDEAIWADHPRRRERRRNRPVTHGRAPGRRLSPTRRTQALVVPGVEAAGPPPKTTACRRAATRAGATADPENLR